MNKFYRHWRGQYTVTELASDYVQIRQAFQAVMMSDYGLGVTISNSWEWPIVDITAVVDQNKYLMFLLKWS